MQSALKEHISCVAVNKAEKSKVGQCFSETSNAGRLVVFHTASHVREISIIVTRDVDIILYLICMPLQWQFINQNNFANRYM